MLRRAAPLVALTVFAVGAISHASARPPARVAAIAQRGRPSVAPSAAHAFAPELAGPPSEADGDEFGSPLLDGVPAELGFESGQARVAATAATISGEAVAAHRMLIAENRPHTRFRR